MVGVRRVMCPRLHRNSPTGLSSNRILLRAASVSLRDREHKLSVPKDGLKLSDAVLAIRPTVGSLADVFGVWWARLRRHGIGAGAPRESAAQGGGGVGNHLPDYDDPPDPARPLDLEHRLWPPQGAGEGPKGHAVDAGLEEAWEPAGDSVGKGRHLQGKKDGLLEKPAAHRRRGTGTRPTRRAKVSVKKGIVPRAAVENFP